MVDLLKSKDMNLQSWLVVSTTTFDHQIYMRLMLSQLGHLPLGVITHRASTCQDMVLVILWIPQGLQSPLLFSHFRHEKWNWKPKCTDFLTISKGYVSIYRNSLFRVTDGLILSLTLFWAFCWCFNHSKLRSLN